jgi:hypothetical protein
MKFGVLGKLAAISEREREEMRGIGVYGCGSQRGKAPMPDYILNKKHACL